MHISNKREIFMYFSAMMSCLLVIILLSSCENTSNVKLFNYENIEVPEDVYEVSDGDLSFAIKLKLIEKEVIVPKSGISIFVEDGDIVDVVLFVEGKEKCNERIVVGDEEISEKFDLEIIGKKIKDSYIFADNGDLCKVYIENVYSYADEITDDISKKYFEKSTKSEAENAILKEIEDHRKFEYMYEKLITGSMVKINDDKRIAYIEMILKNIKSEAENNNLAFDDYMKKFYDCTIEEYKENLNSFYDEYVILQELMKKELITVSEDEFNKYLLEFAEMNYMSENEFLNTFGEEQIYYSIYYEKAYDVLLKYA